MCTPFLARSTFGSEHVKNTRVSDHLLTIRLPFAVEKVHAVVAQSTFGSQTCRKLRVLSLFILKCQMSLCRQIDGYRYLKFVTLAKLVSQLVS